MASYTSTDAGITSTTTSRAPGPTGSSVSSNPAHPSASTTHPTQSATGGSGGLKEGVQGVKGVLAGIHGIGEKVRGEFNEGVDQAFNENGSQAEGVARNAAVANAGDNELTTGQFAHATKNREGAAPGDEGRRY